MVAQSTVRSTALTLAALAVLLCYARVAGVLVEMWSANPLFSYGFVVPVISVYVAWMRWPAVRQAPVAPDTRTAIPVLAAASALLIVGRLGGLASLQECSLPLAIAGLSLLLFGRSVFAALWFPIAYLALSMSIWNPLITALQPPSRVLSGRLATIVLQTVAVPALLQGTSIVLPNVTLDVWPECSGVNQVLAIVAVALPTTYLFLRGSVRRIGFVAFAIAVAYLSNGLRIALSGWLAYHGLGDGNLRGVHVLEGVAVSTFGYVLLFVCLLLFSRGDRRDTVSAAPEPMTSVRAPHAAWTFAPLTAMLAVGVGLVILQTVQIRPSADLRSLPPRVGAWTVDVAAGSRFPAFDEEFLGLHPTLNGERMYTDVDEELVRSYRNAAGARLHLYVGYRRAQEEGHELVGTVGRALEPRSSPVIVPVGLNQIELNRVVQDNSSRRRGVLYWYDLNGRIVTDVYRVRAYAMWDALTRRRTNGAILMVAWESAPGTAPGAAEANAVAFAEALLPLLPRYLPS